MEIDQLATIVKEEFDKVHQRFDSLEQEVRDMRRDFSADLEERFQKLEKKFA